MVTSLAQPVGQGDRAAQLLVGVADVEAGADVHLDGLVELRAAWQSLTSVIAASAGAYSRSRSTCASALVGVGDPRAATYATTSTPIERAVPAMILAA